MQVFYFVNNFHDHLPAAPIGFTAAAGNFEAVNGDAGRAGRRRRQTQPRRRQPRRRPAGRQPHRQRQHVDAARRHRRRACRCTCSTTRHRTRPTRSSPINGGDDADIVYHEYTHGLSNRLVVDANGNSTLGDIQAGAMGEAWSDWYAMDFLVNAGLPADTAAAGDLRIGEYVGDGADLIRTQPIDCPVGARRARCPGTPGAGPGGYTYGDFGKIIGQPEVHADGEIWGETLWDLRKALGSQADRVAGDPGDGAVAGEPVVSSTCATRSCRPTRSVYGGSRTTTIWKVFAHRGMGYFAGAVDGDDTAPVEDFSPAAGPGHADRHAHAAPSPTRETGDADVRARRRLRRPRLRLPR